MVIEFFKNLGRQKMTGIEGQAKAKVANTKARAKMKAAGAVNKKMKGAKDKAADKVKGKMPNKKNAPTPTKENPMAAQQNNGGGEDIPSFADKTQFIPVMTEEKKKVLGWLVALNGALEGQDFRVYDGKNIIGTAADVDIVLTDQYMSSRHAVLRHEAGEFMLVDLDSTNGTYVNGHQISKEQLIDNDRVRFGRTELKFKSLY